MVKESSIWERAKVWKRKPDADEPQDELEKSDSEGGFTPIDDAPDNAPSLEEMASRKEEAQELRAHLNDGGANRKETLERLEELGQLTDEEIEELRFKEAKPLPQKSVSVVNIENKADGLNLDSEVLVDGKYEDEGATIENNITRPPSDRKDFAGLSHGKHGRAPKKEEVWFRKESRNKIEETEEDQQQVA